MNFLTRQLSWSLRRAGDQRSIGTYLSSKQLQIFVHAQLDNETLTVRADNDVCHGNVIVLTPQQGRIHNFDIDGLAIT